MTIVWQLTGSLTNSDTMDSAFVEIATSMRDVDDNMENNFLEITIVYSTLADLAISNLYVCIEL